MADHHAEHDCDEHCLEQRNVAIALIFVTGESSFVPRLDSIRIRDPGY
jgi:hypothetical protein